MPARNVSATVAVAKAAVITASIIIAAGCGKQESAETPGRPANQDQIQAVSSSDGWIELSADPALSAWTLPSPGAWKLTDGVMEKSEGGGYIWTKERFGDFILDCEFKISEGGNSGIFFRTDNVNDPVQTGIEMQVYNVPRNPQPVKNDCGAVYDLLAPSVYADKPAGEWNHVVLTCDDNIITIDLNDVRIIDMNIDNWDTAGMNPDGTKNKFSRALKDFKREGYIGFQEHGDPVWFRNVKIKRL
jgi:hypothetical protein